ncbi:MAG TPA: hypothetical protein VNZ53_19990 [Steroidobacteraceae bacterium]|nr:hypothetical protein [Steroidobacteraceae bacterium]
MLAAGGTIAGALVAFFLSRSVSRPTGERLIATCTRLRNLDALITQYGLRWCAYSPVMSFAVASYMLGRSSIDLRSYTIGTLASLPTLCGYVFIGKTTRRAAFLAEMVPWSALCGHQALAADARRSSPEAYGSASRRASGRRPRRS